MIINGYNNIYLTTIDKISSDKIILFSNFKQFTRNYQFH